MSLLLDRHWLLTSTTYGTWLPGDERGFVGPIDDDQAGYEVHNEVGTSYDADIAPLKNWCATQLLGEPIYLVKEQADQLVSQFQETATHRSWILLAASVMNNHFHVLLTVPGDPEPEYLLRDVKAYASRKLNNHWPRPQSNTWWTESGSKRKKRNVAAIRAAVAYVWNQPGWLARFVHEEVPRDWLVKK